MRKLLREDIASQALREYSDMVFKLAFSQLKNKADAEDIFQEVFVRLVKSNVQFESEEHLKAWLVKATINRCKSLRSSAWFRHTQPLDESLQAEEKSLEKDNNLYIKVMELPQKYRAVIHLFYYEDMSIADISSSLNIKKETIASQLSRGRAILKRKLGGNYEY